MFENYYQRDKHRERWAHTRRQLKLSSNGRLPREMLLAPNLEQIGISQARRTGGAVMDFLN